ncbi:BTAD domain-containing putative transcriptional regulator [Kitasatospora sp. NPDC001547]|uniref:AfsR/SARP family transcriptional regulator n=1 Tax=Kitasatospora sp. NPDC001547 TaxID=3364015 RepID=UPI00368B4F27
MSNSRTTVGISSPKQQAVLSALALSNDRKLTTEKIATALWGTEQPRTAAETVRTHVYLLRKTLRAAGIDIVGNSGRSYQLDAEKASVDLDEFRRIVSLAEAAKLDGRTAEAADRYAEGIRLWHGEPLRDVPGPLAEAKRTFLGELLRTTRSERLRCRMRLGEHLAAATELWELTAENPLDEGLRELLMVCLFRANRQADSLAVFRETGRLLKEELGVGPSPQLSRTHQRILDRDPALLWSPEAAPGPAPRSGAPHRSPLHHPPHREERPPSWSTATWAPAASWSARSRTATG